MKCPKCETVNAPDSQFCKRCATPLPSPSFTRTMEMPADELARGTVFAGRYEIIEELGAGGMGRVYRAHDTKLNEEVALKLIKPEIAADKRTVERFHNEIKIARKISHKNVCRTHDLHEESRTLYLTMEYVRGEDLKSLIHRTKTLSVGTALAIARQMAEGLAEAHKLGIVHRDLKPGNVMIDKDGQAKIMDFGVARAMREKGITGAGAIIGTPEYMSPEQVEGKEADQRADIYALGIILFEMVTGRVPFEGETAFAIANKQKSELPPAPRKLVPQIPESLNKLILRCLEKDREKRHQTADELIADLAAVEDALPTGERIAPKLKTATRREITVKHQPHRLIFPAVALAALVAVLVFVWKPWSGRGAFTPPPRIENSIAVVSFRNETGDAGYDRRCSRAIPDLMITSLENAGLFQVATWERMSDLLEQMGKKDVEFIDSDLGFALCRRGGIAHVVSGSLTKSGETYVTDIKIWDAASRKLRKALAASGRGEDSILGTQIGELSRGICEALGIALEKIGPGRLNIAGVTTSSMEAYELYLQSQELFRRWKYNEAKELLEKAIAVDPSFATAYRKLATVYSNLQDNPARSAANAKARELSAQATEKEKLYIDGQQALYKGDIKAYIQNLERITARYPAEKEAHYWLGDYVSRWYVGDFRDLKRGIREQERVIELDPGYAEAYSILARIYQDLGEFEKAIECAKKYGALLPGNLNAGAVIGTVYFNWGKLDKAVASLRQGLRLSPDNAGLVWKISYAAALREDYASALAWIEDFLGKAPQPSRRFMTLKYRAFLKRWLGRFEEASRDIEEAAKIAESQGNKRYAADTDYWRAVASWEQGDFVVSRQFIDRWLTKMTELYPGLAARTNGTSADYLYGFLDLEQGNPESARKRLAGIEAFAASVLDADLKSFFALCGDTLASEIGLREGRVDMGRILQVSAEEPAFLEHHRNANDINDVIEYLHFPPFERDFVPRAHLLMGDADKAIAAYERLVTFDPLSKDRRLIHPRNYYSLGKLYEQKGDKRKARANYRKFLDLWKNADPGLPEVEDARKRLAAL